MRLGSRVRGELDHLTKENNTIMLLESEFTLTHRKIIVWVFVYILYSVEFTNYELPCGNYICDPPPPLRASMTNMGNIVAQTYEHHMMLWPLRTSLSAFEIPLTNLS